MKNVLLVGIMLIYFNGCASKSVEPFEASNGEIQKDKIKNEGTTVFLVEQDVQLALENSDYGYVLDTGRIAMEGPSKKLIVNPDVKKVYLGL